MCPQLSGKPLSWGGECPPEFVSTQTQNVALFGNKLLADVISEDEVMLRQGGPCVQRDRCPYKRGVWTLRHAEE